MDRKERLRAELEHDSFLEDDYEREQIDRKPSRLRVFGRKVMDKMGVKSERSERIRDREAMAEVLREYREEKERRRLEALEQEEARRLAAERLEKEIAERAAENERRKLEADMSKARAYFERHEKSRARGERVQESVEREFNSRLTTVEGLEEAVMAEEEGVSKRTIEYEGSEIVVYDLTGLPFEMISHAVDYRYANWSVGSADIGNKTAQDLLEHPENWEKTREEAEASPGYGTRREDALGDVISASYVNSERNIGTRVSRYGSYYTLCYGFERVRPDSILYTSGGDAGSSNTGGKGETLLSEVDMDAIERFEGAGGASGYNELVLRRYDESGEPLRPSYIIAEDGHITEEMLRHAKHFGIPIINIERKPYEERLERKAHEAVDSISEDSTYDEISRAITVLRRAPRYHGKFTTIGSVGRLRDSAPHEQEKSYAAPGSFEEKVARLEELEFEKRMELIEEALRAGRAPGASAPEGFEYFSALTYQVRGTRYDAPGSCNWISVEFRRKGEARSVRTEIYDGGDVVRGEEAVRIGNITQKELDAGDSSVYRRIAPLIEEYSKR